MFPVITGSTSAPANSAPARYAMPSTKNMASIKSKVHHTVKPHILIVDDEPMIRSLFSATLQNKGYEIHLAKNGHDALNIATTAPLDLIFLDLRMPHLDGVGFLTKFNRQCSNKCPIIAITGYDDDVSMNQCYDQGVFAIVRKPLGTAEIIALSKRYTGRAQTKSLLQEQLDIINKFKDNTHPPQEITSSLTEEMLEALPIPLFYKDDQLTYQRVNRAFEQFTGFSKEQMKGKNIFDIAPTHLARKIDNMEQELLKNGGMQSYVDFLQDSSGQQREVIFYRTAMGNGLPGIMGLIVDINDFNMSSYGKRLVALHPQLTQRELQIANLVRIGMTNKEIAKQLDVSLSTVEFHRHNLRDKLGLKGNRTNLSAYLMAI